MSAQALAVWTGHIHLPSVHVRNSQNDGFDYEEDLFVEDDGRGARISRLVTFAFVFNDVPLIEKRQTHDTLSAEEAQAYVDNLPLLLDEGNPEAEGLMQSTAHDEYARQQRIARGEELACLGCGCSESRGCSGGCLWATPTICSRCVS